VLMVPKVSKVNRELKEKLVLEFRVLMVPKALKVLMAQKEKWVCLVPLDLKV